MRHDDVPDGSSQNSLGTMMVLPTKCHESRRCPVMSPPPTSTVVVRPAACWDRRRSPRTARASSASAWSSSAATSSGPVTGRGADAYLLPSVVVTRFASSAYSSAVIAAYTRRLSGDFHRLGCDRRCDCARARRMPWSLATRVVNGGLRWLHRSTG